MEETRQHRRRPLLTVLVLAIAASVVLVAVAWWSVGRSPVGSTYPDVNPPGIEWSVLPSTPGSVTADVGGAVGLMVRMRSSSFDPRADRLYVALERRIVAFDPRDGGADWWRDLDAGAGPVVANYGDYVGGPADYGTYVGVGPATLRVFNDTSPGDPTIEDVPIGATVVDIAAYVSDTVAGRTGADIVLVATDGGELVAVWAANYSVAWRASFFSQVRLAEQGNSITAVPVYGAAFSDDGTRAFVSTEDGEAFAVNASSGQVLFPFSATPVSAAPIAFPYFGGTRVLVGQADGFLWIFDEGGTIVGGLGVTSGPIAHIATDGFRAVVLSREGEVVGVELDEGGAFPSIDWRARLAGGPSGPAQILPEKAIVIVADLTGRVTGFRISGSLDFRIKVCESVTAGPTMWAPVQSIDSMIWTGCGDGSVHGLR